MPALHWASLADFLAMGGYGLYVWGSFAVTAAVLAWELVALRRRRRRALEGARQWRLLHQDPQEPNGDLR
ncbi:heme exporter protein CcmD [Pseudorhodoferax sp.]|uniref:heme exporter protein CcmD n=1 Tax=Pseudorhodoferax sp. TaxID=1993553 RepID=UPI002DD6B1AD|nr:heme exporter protein CcmD [Pseudorhodoferax sp.]